MRSMSQPGLFVLLILIRQSHSDKKLQHEIYRGAIGKASYEDTVSQILSQIHYSNFSLSNFTKKIIGFNTAI